MLEIDHLSEKGAEIRGGAQGRRFSSDGAPSTVTNRNLRRSRESYTRESGRRMVHQRAALERELVIAKKLHLLDREKCIAILGAQFDETIGDDMDHRARGE